MTRPRFARTSLTRRAALGLSAALLLAAPVLAQDAAPGQKIVALGGSVTETIVALGEGARLIGRDSTSSYPESVLALPDVGYVRQISPEGVLSLDPDLIIAEGGAGPLEAIEVLKSAGIPYVAIPQGSDPGGIAEKVRAIGVALGTAEKGEALALEIDAALADVAARAATVETPKRVLFILSNQGGRIMVGGEGTEAEAIIRLAGGINAGTGFQGYKQMTDEAILTAAPDVLLMMDREGDLAIHDADILAHPALSQTPAAEAKAIIRMDGLLLLGFGPRTPQAAGQLFDALYPEAAK